MRMDSVVEPVAARGGRARTRRAILDAAASVLSKNPAASLGDIAAAAGVGRTTVHRYFPERSDLLAALGRHLLDRIATATDRARPEEGTALEALERLCQEYFELGDVLLYAFEEPHLIRWEEWEEETEADRQVLALIRRGHAEGLIDERMPPTWVHQLLWSTLYVGWQYARESGVPKLAALDLSLHTFKKAIAAER